MHLGLSQRRAFEDDAQAGLGSLLLLLSLATVGCTDEVVPFVGDVSRSKYFEYHDQSNETLCPDLLSFLDKHVEIMGGLIGMSLNPDATNFRYYRFQDFTSYHETFSNSGGVSIGSSL